MPGRWLALGSFAKHRTPAAVLRAWPFPGDPTRLGERVHHVTPRAFADYPNPVLLAHKWARHCA